MEIQKSLLFCFFTIFAANLYGRQTGGCGSSKNSSSNNSSKSSSSTTTNFLGGRNRAVPHMSAQSAGSGINKSMNDQHNSSSKNDGSQSSSMSSWTAGVLGYWFGRSHGNNSSSHHNGSSLSHDHSNLNESKKIEKEKEESNLWIDYICPTTAIILTIVVCAKLLLSSSGKQA
jgi:hypothetical protein